MADADIHTNPFEVGLDRLVALDSDINSIEALQKYKHCSMLALRYLEILCKAIQFYGLSELCLGKVTSAVYSPRLKKNIALAMIDINHSSLGPDLSFTFWNIIGAIGGIVLIQKNYHLQCLIK